jgi:hypothetical protein
VADQPTIPEEIYGGAPILYAELDEAAQLPGRRFSIDTSGHPQGLELGLDEGWTIEDYRLTPGVEVAELPPYTLLVITQRDDREGHWYWLIECDETFEHMADTQHGSVGEAKLQARMIYGDVKWLEVPA